jgi:predicted nucleic acid-binding protein
MSKYLFDTSILLHYVRGSDIAEYIDGQYQPSTLPNYSVVSVVSLGEMYSLSYSLKWGQQKQESLKRLLNSIPAVDINHSSIINCFAEIDAYRQGKHPSKPLPQGESARAIGDNDLWIASTASILKATLLTLDKDFLLFNDVFLDVIYFDQEQFKEGIKNRPSSL